MRKYLYSAAFFVCVFLLLEGVAAAGGFSPGAAGSGDLFFPVGGNGGRDVGNHGLPLAYEPPSGRLTGETVITATATQDLSRFDLDLRGFSVSQVLVDGRAPVPSPGVTHPQLILVQSDLNAIRARIDSGQEPQASAWAVFVSGRVAPALSASPAVYAGPVTSGGVGTPLEQALDKDGAAARNLALAYALTGDVTYASKARLYLLAWASGNTPTSFADCGDKWAGSYQSHGAFMFAYAYDLAYSSGIFSAADVTAIEGWFRRFVDALDTYNTQLRSEWVISNPGYELPYVWDATRHYNVYDNYVGGDMALLQQTARLAMARVIGYSNAVGGILSDPGNILGLESMSRSSLEPRNDGVGVPGNPASIPQVDMYKQPIAGRGGTIDYMTYNTRVDAVLLELAENAGWNGATLRSRLKTSWDYLARFFGANAQPSFVPGDVPMTSVCLPRFALAYRTFGDARYLDVLNSGARSSYYEPQLLGPVTLTHSIAR